MGNTNIVIGCIDSHKTYFVERVTTDHAKTGTEYAINIKNILEIHQIDPSEIEGAIMSSVVPPLNAAISSAVKKILGYHPMLVGAGIKTGMNIIMDNPKTVGSDMIVDAHKPQLFAVADVDDFFFFKSKIRIGHIRNKTFLL